MARALTDDEKAIFERIRESNDVALLNCMFEGEEAAVIVVVTEDGTDSLIFPVALLLTDEHKERLTMDGAKISPT